MDDPVTRRRLLAATAAGATLGPPAIGAVRGQVDDPCGRYRSLEADSEEDRTAVEELEGELAAAEGDIRELMAEIHRRREELREPHPYDSSLRDRALQVGLDARDAVVFLHGEHENSGGTGTAWFVDEHRLLTNAHVADAMLDAEAVLGFTLSGESEPVEVVSMVESWEPDVALLRTDLPAPATLSPASSGGLSPGDPLVQVGNPSQFWPWVVALGELTERQSDDLVSTLPSRGGFSGSPVLTLDGTVVGMTHASHTTGGAEFEDGRPLPTDAPIEQYPLEVEHVTSHVPGEVVREKLEGWT